MGVRLYCVILVLIAWVVLANALGGYGDPVAKVVNVMAMLRMQIIASFEGYATTAPCAQAGDTAPVHC